ncbi:unnamed protein product, partial [Meganyctiphanes norvegica]
MNSAQLNHVLPDNVADPAVDGIPAIYTRKQVFRMYLIYDFTDILTVQTGMHSYSNFKSPHAEKITVHAGLHTYTDSLNCVITFNLTNTPSADNNNAITDNNKGSRLPTMHGCRPVFFLSCSSVGCMHTNVYRRLRSPHEFQRSVTSFVDLFRQPEYHPGFCSISTFIELDCSNVIRSREILKTTESGQTVFPLCTRKILKKCIKWWKPEKTVNVWDLNETITDSTTIQTIASVGRIKWRPGKKYHIASSAIVMDCSINVWDIRRPYIPLATFNEHKKLTTGIAWRGEPNSLLSVGKDCKLYHHAFKDATRPVDHINPVGLDMSIYGHVSVAAQTKEDSEPTGPLVKLPVFRRSPAINEHTGPVLSLVQILHSQEESPVSAHQMIQSAQQYQLTGRSLSEICEHNASVARKLDRQQIALTWQMLQMLYVAGSELPPITTRDETIQQPDTSLENDQKSTRHYSGGEGGGGDTSCGGLSAEEGDTETDDNENNENIKLSNIASGLTLNQDFFFGDGEINQIPFDYDNLNNIGTSQEWTLPNEAFQPRHQILHRSTTPPTEMENNSSPRDIQESGSYVITSPSVLKEVQSFGIERWDFSKLVIDMVEHYAASGDVQMAVTVVIVLGDKFKGEIEPNQLEHWFQSYIDLLQRFQLWNISNQVIKLAVDLPSIQQLNKKSTTFSLQCGQCAHTLQKNKLMCRKCGAGWAICSVCHGTVRGLYVWCQGCSHGGHLNHIMEWMAQHKECPASCGHICEYT